MNHCIQMFCQELVDDRVDILENGIAEHAR